MYAWLCLSLLLVRLGSSQLVGRQADGQKSHLPIIVNTWPFTDATEAAWQALQNNVSTTPAIDAVVEVSNIQKLVQIV